MDKPDFSVIIVTYNSADHIIDNLNSIFKFLPKNTEVIVVDNNSQDNTVSRVEKYKKVNLIVQSENLGFSKSCNIGANSSQGRYLFFLNPDAKIEQFNNKEVLSYLENNPDVGILAPQLIMSSGKIQPSVVKTPTIFRAFLEYYLGIKNSYREYAPQTSNPLVIENAYGAAYIINRDFYNNMGGFDEKYFLYFEDLDLCRKVNKLGKRIIYYPDIKIRHAIGSSSKTNPNTLSLHRKSAIQYYGLLNYYLLTFLLRLRPIKT